jgi:hypothetical protein
MSILQYDNFNDWDGFRELNLACMRLKDDDSKLRALVAEVPEDLRQEASLYLLDYSMTQQSAILLKLATELGVFDIPGVKNNLEIAMTLRDRMFTTTEEPSAGHLEILRQSAELFGEGFAIDSISAVYNDEFARQRAGARSFANGKEKLDAYSANLKLFVSFTAPKILANPDIGNIGIRHIRSQIMNFREGDPIGNHLKQLGETLHFDDFVAIANVMTEQPFNFGQHMLRQIDAGVCQGLPRLSLDYLQNLPLALKVRPMNTLMSLVTMKESEFSRFVSGDGLFHYLTSSWITKNNAEILKDQNFLDLHDLFNQRLLASAYLPGALVRHEGLERPRTVSVTLAMMLPQLKEKGVRIDLSNEYGMLTFAQSLALMKGDPKHAEVVRYSHEAIADTLVRDAVSLYARMLNADHLKKHMKPLELTDKDERFKLVAVRLCAELHQPRAAHTRAELDRLKPISQLYGETIKGLNHKDALLALVETYDEATILGALKGYKPGIKPLIELGVLDRKHMALLPAKDRGDMLESAMGL